MKILVINCSPVRNGATAEIVNIVSSYMEKENEVKSICIDDYNIQFCKGCRTCHQTARCILKDDTTKLISEYEWADKIISVSPSYWADIPGQFKVLDVHRGVIHMNLMQPYRKVSMVM